MPVSVPHDLIGGLIIRSAVLRVFVYARALQRQTFARKTGRMTARQAPPMARLKTPRSFVPGSSMGLIR